MTTQDQTPTTKSKKNAAPVGKKDFSDKLAAAIETNRKTVFGAIIIAVVAIGGIAFAQYMERRAELAAQEEIYSAEQEWDTKLAESKKPEDGKKEDPKNPVATPPEDKKLTKEELAGTYGEVLGKYKAAIEKNKSSKAASVAALDLSNVYAEAGDYPSALSVLAVVDDQPAKKDVLYGLIKMAIGTTYLATNEAPKAIDVFSALVEEKAQVHLHPAAYIKLGLAQELAGDKAKAQQAFEKVRDEYPKSASAQVARSYLRYMILSENK